VVRSPLEAFGIGLVHGVGGRVGLGVVLPAMIPSEAIAFASIDVLAAFTAISMTGLTAGFGTILGTRTVAERMTAVAPALGAAGLGFGLWYGAAAWDLTSYPF
jgi:hypothetical protein